MTYKALAKGVSHYPGRTRQISGDMSNSRKGGDRLMAGPLAVWQGACLTIIVVDLNTF